METSTWLVITEKNHVFLSLHSMGLFLMSRILPGDVWTPNIHRGTFLYWWHPAWHHVLRHIYLSVVSIPPLIPFLGWIWWILLWLTLSSYVCPSSVLHSHSFQPNVPARWVCAPFPLGAAPYHNALKIFSASYLRWVSLSTGIGGPSFSRACCHHRPKGSKCSCVLSFLWDAIHPYVQQSTSILSFQTWVRFNRVCEKGLKQQDMRLNYGLICH